MAEPFRHELLTDLPETDPDLLWEGLSALSRRLAIQLPQLPRTSPVLISGDWGSGKTTLLRAIERELKDQGIPSVWFEAWRYEGVSELLPALMRTIWNQAEKKPDPKLRARLWNAALAVASGVGSDLAVLAGGPATILIKALLSARKEDERFLKGPTDEPPEDETEVLFESFRELLRELWEERAPVIFIDDLDRCSPAGAVELLDSLRMLISQAFAAPIEESAAGPPCHFVVALDKTVLAEAVAKKFSAVGRYEGNRYLEKIFPLSFDLPRPEGTAIHQFVRFFLEKARRLDEQAAKRAGQRADEEEGNSHLDALSIALSEPLFANPRLMKRCINRFYLVLRFEDENRVERSRDDERSPPAISPEEKGKRDVTLASWIAASERWPHLRRLLSSQDDEYWKKIRHHLIDSNGGLPDGEASALLEERGVSTWMLKELLGGKGTRLPDFRQADRRLRKWGL